MASSLCKIDRDLAGRAVLRIVDKTVIDSELIGFGFKTKPKTSPKVEFQFPPKVVSDGRSSDWREEYSTLGEMATISSVDNRETTLEWTYIVGMGGWTTEDVKRNVALMRSYYSLKLAEAYHELQIQFQLWLIGGQQPMSYRLKSIEVSHGKAIVAPLDKLDKPKYMLDRAYPLRTDIRANLKVWTLGYLQQEKNAATKLHHRIGRGWH